MSKILDLIKSSNKEFSKHIVNIAIMFFSYQLLILLVNFGLSQVHKHEYIRYIYFIGKSFNFTMYGLMLTHFIFYVYYARENNNHLIIRSIIQPILSMGNLFKHVIFVVFLGVGSNFTYLFKAVNPDVYRMLSNPTVLTLYGSMNYLFMLSVFIVLVYIIATISSSYFLKSTTLSNFFFYSLDCLQKTSIINSNAKFMQYKGDFLKLVFICLVIAIVAASILLISKGFTAYLFNIILIYFINMWVLFFLAHATVSIYCSRTNTSLS